MIMLHPLPLELRIPTECLEAGFLRSSGQTVGAVNKTADFFTAAARRGGGWCSSHFRVKKSGKRINGKQRHPGDALLDALNPCLPAAAPHPARSVLVGLWIDRDRHRR